MFNPTHGKIFVETIQQHFDFEHRSAYNLINDGYLSESRAVLREVLVVVRVVDRVGRVGRSERLGSRLACKTDTWSALLALGLELRLTVNVVIRAAVGGEVGGLVDEGARARVRAGVGGAPESAAKVDNAKAELRSAIVGF